MSELTALFAFHVAWHVDSIQQGHLECTNVLATILKPVGVVQSEE